MPLLRLLGFARLDCGCLVGRYREMAVQRPNDYIEEKGQACGCQDHRRNQLVPGRTLERARWPAVAHAS